MSAMVPVFADNTLDHLVRLWIFRIGVRARAGAIDSAEILVVFIFCPVFLFFLRLVESVGIRGEFVSPTVTSELSLGVQQERRVDDFWR